MSAPLLELKKVEKVFGGLRAIGGVSFTVEPKQIFGLIGPNGAGKTTIFNCITGVYCADGGDVLFGGHSIKGWKPFKVALGGIGRTFQNIRLFGEMTVIENVMVAAHHRQKSGVLGAMLGAFLGWKLVLLSILLSVLIGGPLAATLLATGRKGRKDPLPFGPFLAVGAVISLFCGEAVLAWYFAQFAA